VTKNAENTSFYQYIHTRKIQLYSTYSRKTCIFSANKYFAYVRIYPHQHERCVTNHQNISRRSKRILVYGFNPFRRTVHHKKMSPIWWIYGKRSKKECWSIFSSAHTYMKWHRYVWHLRECERGKKSISYFSITKSKKTSVNAFYSWVYTV